ncbi:MAG: RNA polymerase sigma factor [Polyangiaceae bacterium]|nr:RNA polymerase sigma factor [Polyangiaceae bacterium]
MAGIRDGDQSMATLLYDRLFPVVDHTVYRVFGRRESDHDDLIQSAFEQIVITLSRRSFARACSLRTWASTVTSHVALNALRSRRRERRVFDRTVDVRSDLGMATGDPERDVVARATIDRVRGELTAMRPDRAETVFLHDVLGHDLAEIALTTGVSIAAAQSRLVRGRRELHERLSKSALGDRP